MAESKLMGRRSIFREKEGGDRVQGVITKQGAQEFGGHRANLEALVKRVTGRDVSASDADVIEYLARGHKATADYLKSQK